MKYIKGSKNKVVKSGFNKHVKYIPLFGQDWDRVKDCLYLQARIYHSLSLTNQRNMAAQQYKKFDEMYPTISPVNHLLLI